MNRDDILLLAKEKIIQPIWGNWYIKEKIGNGSFSAVYRVEAKRMNRIDQSALKIEAITAEDTLFIDGEKKKSLIEQKRAQVENESLIMYQLRKSPYIVGYEEEDIQELIIDGQFEGYLFLIRMELLKCVSSIIRNKQMDFSEKNIIKLAIDIGRGIKAAHDIGVIHRDIKPDNFFLSDEGIYKLGDFNVSKKTKSARSIAGTDGYMAPEIYQAKTDADGFYTRQADIYSFGICLYQFMNNLYFPFEDRDLENAIDRRLNGEKLPAPKNASQEFSKIILKACEFSITARYSTIDEMLFDLENISSINEIQNHTNYRNTSYTDANATIYAENETVNNNINDHTIGYNNDHIPQVNGIQNFTNYRNTSYSDDNATIYTENGTINEDINNRSNSDETKFSRKKQILVGVALSIVSIVSIICISKFLSVRNSDPEINNEVLNEESSDSDFEIENGLLIKYNGHAANVIIPDSVTGIGSNAFYNCSSLKSVTIPDGVTRIASGAFLDCSSLTSITIPNSVTSIGGHAFDNCSSLKSVTIPDGVTRIASGAFLDCSSLTSITIPNSVTSIEGHAFDNCSSLKSVTIPDGVTSIGYYAFKDCSSLTSVTIPDSVTSIGECAFGYTNRLANRLSKINDFKIKCYAGTAGEKYAKDSFEYELIMNTDSDTNQDKTPAAIENDDDIKFLEDYFQNEDNLHVFQNDAFYNDNNIIYIDVDNSIVFDNSKLFERDFLLFDWDFANIPKSTPSELVYEVAYSSMKKCTLINSYTWQGGFYHSIYYAPINTNSDYTSIPILKSWTEEDSYGYVIMGNGVDGFIICADPTLG